MSCDCEACRERLKRREIKWAAERDRKRIARLGVAHVCTCNHFPAFRERLLAGHESDLAACERMRKARAEEPLEHTAMQSTLGVGRSLPVMHYRRRDLDTGGEN